jgi:ubiquinone/menaquinone biosynthesis C-methylase UbiE
MLETRAPMPLPDPIQKAAAPANVEAKAAIPPASRLGVPVALPEYLEQTYWWAYLHPRGVSFFERQWLVNLILWGNYRTLRDAVCSELPSSGNAKVLQVACVYGDFTATLARRLGPSARLDVVDVAPVQLENLRRKVGRRASVVLHHQDSANLVFPDQSHDFVVLFFLLHEQPQPARMRTVAEALRVARRGGKIIFVDYHRPSGLNPLRYVMRPILGKLEPYALDMWSTDIASWLPADAKPTRVEKSVYFGGLYQKVVVTL